MRTEKLSVFAFIQMFFLVFFVPGRQVDAFAPPPIKASLPFRAPGIPKLPPIVSWQIQYTGEIDTSLDVDVFNLDLFETSFATIEKLHERGVFVMCYFSAGSFEDWRPDASRFPSDVLGKDMEGWPGERWLDIRRLDVLAPIMEARLDLAVEKGCDGVDPDNVNGYQNDTDFPLTASDQLIFNRFLSRAAHERGLAIGLKNDLEQIVDLVPYFDWIINEECFSYQECHLLQPFYEKGKPVFVIEYDLAPEKFCPQATQMGFNALFKRRELDAYRVACPQPNQWIEMKAVAPDNLETPLVLRAPKGAGPFPAVVFFHGAPGGQGLEAIRQIATSPPSSIRWDRFLQEDIAVVVADYRYHPPDQLLQGEINAADDATAVVRLLRQLAFIDASRIALMGDSLGGTVVLEAMQGAPVAAAVLNAPATYSFLGYSGQPPPAGCEPPVSDSAIDREAAAAKIARIHNPVLIVQGTADGLCRLNRKLYQLMVGLGKNARLKLYEGQPHGFTNGPDSPEFRQALEDTITFLQPHLRAAGPAPAGLYCRCPPTSAGRHSVMSEVAALDFVTGILVRVSWRDIEPEDGHFDWRLIDGELELARQAGKSVALAVLNGPAAPHWLVAKGAQMFAYTLRETPEQMPLPWDPVYLAAWERLIDRLGERYRNRPELALVHVTHSTANGFEMQLALSASDEQRWMEAGYTPEKLIGSWERVLEAFAKAFPGVPLDVDVHPVLGSDHVAEEVVAYARQHLGAQFGVFAAWWSQKNVGLYPGLYPLLLQAARESFATVQLAGSYTLTPETLGEGGLAQSIQLALESGVRYLEIWDSDLLTPELAPLLQETAERLTPARIRRHLRPGAHF